MILVRSPLRVSLFGGGTDYAQWFNARGGAVLGMAINKYVYCGVKEMPAGQMMPDGITPIRYRVQYSKVDDCVQWNDIHHPAVRGALEYFGVGNSESLEFHIFSDLPGRSGLGGSSACMVSLLHALRIQLNQDYSHGVPICPWTLADGAIYVEQEVIREAVGCQDQVFAAHGGFQYITFERNERILHRLQLPQETLHELETSLILVDTGLQRNSHAMAQKTIEGLVESKEGFEGMKELAYQGLRIIQKGRDLDQIGYLLNDAWNIKKKQHTEITNDKIDKIHERGVKLGAIGGKLCGAGSGGYMLFYVPMMKMVKFQHNIGHKCVNFSISEKGSEVIVND